MGIRQLGINHLSYDGIVSIEIKDKKNRSKITWVHNNGTPALGTVICKSLIRGNVGNVKDDVKPYKINIIAKGDKGIGTSLITSSTQITGFISGVYEDLPQKLRNESNNVIAFTRFTSEISPENTLILENPERLQLVIQDKHGTPLAYIEDDSAGTISEMYSALKNQSVKIDWYLLIKNGSKEG